MTTAEPAIARAAALILHWTRHDIEAVVIMLAEIADQEEAEDIIVALLQMRTKSMDEVSELVLRG